MKLTITGHHPLPSRLAAPSLRFVFLCVSLCFFVVKSSVALANASEPSRKVVLTDGTNIWPENVIAPYTHAHKMGDVDGLETALASKAALSHTHSQYLTTESDPTVSAWAKAATKPTYTAAEVGAQPAGKYVTYDTTSYRLDAVSKETSFAGGLRTDSFKTLYGTPFFNTVSDYGFNITGFYRLNGYHTENNPLLEWDVKTQKSKLAVTTVYEGGTSLSQKYAPISHTHTVSAITDFPTTWDWANLTNKPTAFQPAAHTHAIADTTGLQAALDALAPLSSVTTTTNAISSLAERVAALETVPIATSHAIAYQKASILVVTPDQDGSISWSLDTWPDGAQLLIRLTIADATPTLPDWAHLLGYADLQPASIYTLQAWRYGPKLYLNPILRETPDA